MGKTANIIEYLGEVKNTHKMKQLTDDLMSTRDLYLLWTDE